MMKIAISAQGRDWEAKIDPRFGRAQFFVIFDDQSEQLSVLDNRSNANAMHGAGPNTASALLNSGVNVIITGNGPGGNAARVLTSAGVQVFIGATGTVRQAYEDYKAGRLQRII